MRTSQALIQFPFTAAPIQALLLSLLATMLPGTLHALGTSSDTADQEETD